MRYIKKNILSILLSLLSLLVSGLEEPYRLVEKALELDELQRAYDLPIEELWQRLVQNPNQLEFIMDILMDLTTRTLLYFSPPILKSLAKMSHDHQFTLPPSLVHIPRQNGASPVGI